MGREKREGFGVRIAQTLPRPATALSVVGHAVFLALLTIEAPRHLTVAQQAPAIDVVMVSPPESPQAPITSSLPSASMPAATAPPEADSQSPSSLSPAQTLSPPRMVRPSPSARIAATEYFASAVLDDPHNRGLRKKLATLSSDERLIQLCNIEAMEQLKRWKAGFVPDHVVSYATSDPVLTATSIEATGAAVHSQGKWYRLAFSCASSAGLDRVASFDFTLGRPIPQEEWEQDNLPEQVDGDATD